MSSDSVQPYRDVVLEHHRRPRGRRELAAPDRTGRVANALCGDEAVIQLRLRDSRIAEVAHLGRGCAVLTASGSILADQVVGMTIEQAGARARRFCELMGGDDQPDPDEALGDLLALLEIRAYPTRRRCVTLPWEALLEALG